MKCRHLLAWTWQPEEEAKVIGPFNPAVIAIMPPWYMHRKERLVQNANAH